MRMSFGVFLAACTLSLNTAQAQNITSCMDEQGNIYTVPQSRRVVTVPKKIETKRITIDKRVAKDLAPDIEPRGTDCSTDMLAISPSVCED